MKIEFRWRCVKAFVGNPSERRAYAERTLQFRVPYDTGGCDIALDDPWGPWQDIPEVWEEHADRIRLIRREGK